MATAAKARNPDKLPAALRSYREEIDAALARPLLMTWDDTIAYHEAQDGAAIGAVLIRALHPELSNEQIGYLFKKKLNERGKVRLAQASKVGGKLAHYSHLDFLIEINWERWLIMSGPRRLALIDHELCHFALGLNKKGETMHVLVPHDVEEFDSIVRRWGLWKRDLTRFAKAIEAGAQLDVFANDTEIESIANA